MDNQKIARELVMVAKEMQANTKFHVRIDRNTLGNKRMIELFTPLEWKSFDAIGISIAFQNISKDAERIMRAASYSLGAKFRMAGTTLNVEQNPKTFIVTAILIDDVSSLDEITFAFEEDAFVKSAWVK